jgi:hypothetical protein
MRVRSRVRCMLKLRLQTRLLYQRSDIKWQKGSACHCGQKHAKQHCACVGLHELNSVSELEVLKGLPKQVHHDTPFVTQF